MLIEIQDEQERLPELGGRIREWSSSLLSALGLEGMIVSVLLCDDETIRELNVQWRGIDKATDVLSFPMFDPEEEREKAIAKQVQADGFPPILGDVVISVDTCIRQANEWNHSPFDEALRLWIHGVLHLCGYDHIVAGDMAQMRTKEKEMLILFEKQTIPPLTDNASLD